MGDPSGAGAPDVCQEATWQRHPRKDWLLHSSEAAKSISRGGGNSNVYMKDLQIKTGSSTILPQCSPEPWENQSTIMGKQNKAALLDIQKWKDQKNPTYKWSSEYLVYKSQVSISAVVLVQDFMPHSREEKRTNCPQLPSCTCSLFETHFTGTQFAVLSLLIQLCVLGASVA